MGLLLLNWGYLNRFLNFLLLNSFSFIFLFLFNLSHNNWILFHLFGCLNNLLSFGDLLQFFIGCFRIFILFLHIYWLNKLFSFYYSNIFLFNGFICLGFRLRFLRNGCLWMLIFCDNFFNFQLFILIRDDWAILF